MEGASGELDALAASLDKSKAAVQETGKHVGIMGKCAGGIKEALGNGDGADYSGTG